MIFDIQRFSTHDGPGIRSLVFLKGCTLRCPWCANPEGQSFETELLHNPQRCIGCHACLGPAFGRCVLPASEGSGVKVDRSVPAPAAVADACPSLSLRLAGTEMRVEAIMAEVRKDLPFFAKSGGGLTLSGGEPLAQASLALSLVKACLAEGIDVAIESCLAVGRATIDDFFGLPVRWLVDLKQVDPKVFFATVKGELAPVLSNLGRLAASGAELSIRVPVIPGFNADAESMRAIVAYAAALPSPRGDRRRIDFLPYHELAIGKYALLDRDYPWPRGLSVDRTALAGHADYARSLGLDATIGG